MAYFPVDSTAPADKTEVARSRIVEAARAEFANRGFHAVSLRSVAAAAGVTHPTVLLYFATKNDLLLAALDGSSPASTTADVASRVPRHLLALSAAVGGEAVSAQHPAHLLFSARRDEHLRRVKERLAELEQRRSFHPSRDRSAEASGIVAAGDGLNLLHHYLPDRVDPADVLACHQHLLSTPVATASAQKRAPLAGPHVVASAPACSSARHGGYRSGRRRRSSIVRSALELFARGGYGGVSVREVAERCGASKSALLYHFQSKEDLLRAVLDEVDSLPSARHLDTSNEPGAAVVRCIPRVAAQDEKQDPRAVEARVVLLGEGVPAGHPAHEGFRDRIESRLEVVTACFQNAQASGNLAHDRDPMHEAIWLVALWEGMLRARSFAAVDVPQALSHHIGHVLPAA